MSRSVFTESLDYHGQALLLRAERQKAIASNIANADTPGYAARDFDFAKALRAATGTGSGTPSAGAIGTVATHAGHFPGATAGAGAGRTDSTGLQYRSPDQPSLDANTVDLDRERAQFADNAVRYEASLRFINGSVRTMLSAIRGE